MNMQGPIGQTVGQYRIESLLDSGGMGEVFRGTHIYLNRPAAIKIMRQHLASNQTFRTRFSQEARAAAALKHPNIVEIYDFGEQNNLLYLVMELITDGSLRTLLRQSGARPLTLGLDLVRQTAEGLAAAHDSGMVHRDVKPDNLLLTRLNGPGERYQVKITDFGIARLAEGEHVSMTNAPIGTIAYMSPEQCRGETVDGRSDLYSLGVVLYEVVTGSLPFQINNYNDGIYKHLNMEPPSPRLMRPDLPTSIEEIILRCLAKQPAQRFPSCRDLAQVLASLNTTPDITMMSMPTLLQPRPTGPNQISSAPTDLKEAPFPGSISPTIEQPSIPSGVVVPPEVKTLSGREGRPCVRVLDKQGKNIYTVELGQGNMIVGRQPGCDIVLGDNSVSRKHLQISWDGQRVRIKDLGSGNGTFMNDIRLTPQIEQVWLERQLLRLGDYWLRLEGLGQDSTIASSGGATPFYSSHISTPAADEPTYIKGGETINPTIIKDTSRETHGIYQTSTSGGSQRIGLFTNSKTLIITPGQSTQVQVTITNLGQTVDWFALSVEGVPGHWFQLPLEEVQLTPSTQETVDLYINVARLPNNQAQEYPVTIRARSREKPSEAGATRMLWTVQPFKEDSLLLEPRRARGQGAAIYTLTLRNGGNTQERYDLRGDDDEQKLHYQFAAPVVGLNAGQETRIGLRVETNKRFIGSEQRNSFQIHARPTSGTPPLVSAGEFINRALLPTWIIPLTLALVLATGGIVAAASGLLPSIGGRGTVPPTPNVAATITAIAQIDGVSAAKTAQANTNTTATAQANTNTTGTAQAQNGNGTATAQDQNGSTTTQAQNRNGTATAQANATTTAQANATVQAQATATATVLAHYAQYSGTWMNDNANTNDIPKMVITNNGQLLTLHGYGACSPSYCDWGTVKQNFSEAPMTVVFTFDGSRPDACCTGAGNVTLTISFYNGNTSRLTITDQYTTNIMHRQ